MKNIIAKVKYYGKKEHPVNYYTTKLDKWLKGKVLEFHPIKKAEFKKMAIAVIEFDRDHCIYILLEEDVFNSDAKLPSALKGKE